MPWSNLWSSSKKDEVSAEPTPTERVKQTIDSVLDAGQTGNDSKSTLQPQSYLSAFSELRTLFAAAVLTTGLLTGVRFYRRYLRRIPEAINIRPSFFRKRSIVGKVTSVGDGDNFRIFHTPGGRLAGWGWLRSIPNNVKELKHRTVS